MLREDVKSLYNRRRKNLKKRNPLKRQKYRCEDNIAVNTEDLRYEDAE